MEFTERKKSVESPTYNRPTGCIQQRYIMAAVAALVIVAQFILKANLSVAIVAMVKPLPSDNQDGRNHSFKEINETRDGEFSWDMEMQGNILSAYYYGYLSTHFLGGYAASHWGGKIVVGPGMTFNALLTLLSPISARQGGPWYFFVVRFLQGLSSGVIGPGLLSVYSVWFPPQERTAFSGAIFSAMHIGSLIGTAASGPLSDLPIDGGWPMIFYCFGLMSLVVCLLWWFLVYDSPAIHPRITEEEKNYILGGLGLQEEKIKRIKEFPVPWLSILTDIHLWAAIIYSWGLGWILYTLLSDLPTYMKNILHFNIQRVAFLAALPALFSWVTSVFAGVLSQWLRRNNYLTHLQTYRIFDGIASLGIMACLIGVTQVGYDPKTIVILLIVNGALSGFVFGGSYINHLDLASNYAGITSGIQHTIVSTTGVIAPLAVASIVKGKQTVAQWSIVFYLAAGITAGTYFIYLLFGSVEERPWNNPDRMKQREEKLQEKYTMTADR